MIVVLAGHVDHGKSTLVRLLTDMEPDRLEEERRRGLTIDLGFSWTLLRSGRKVGFIDVPGHERFVRNMLGGCGGANAALLVVSAGEGWKPQTEEHVQILDLLGIGTGVIAISHVDLVDAATADAVHAQISAKVQGTFLENAPVVWTALNDPASIERLRNAIESLPASMSYPPDAKRPRLWIDRSFTLAGAGRVVTGTLTGGALSVDQEVALNPLRSGAAAARIRSIRCFGEPVKVAEPSSRVALNLSRLKAKPARGQAVAIAEQWSEGQQIHVSLRPVRSLVGLPRARAAYSIAVGTQRLPARLRYLEETPSGSRGPALAQVRVGGVLGPAGIGDRFVLRDEGTSTTVAGGTILGIDATTTRYDPIDLAARMRALTTAEDRQRLVALTSALLSEHDGIVDAMTLRRWIGTAHPPGTVRVGEGVMLKTDYLGLRADLLGRISRGDDALGKGAATLAITEQLAREGHLKIRANVVRRADECDVARVVARDAVETALARSEPPLLTRSELRDASGVDGHTISQFVGNGALVELGDFVATRAQYEQYCELVASALASGSKTTSELRQHLGLPRRYALPLLETLDRSGLTYREGNLRSLRCKQITLHP